VRGGGLHIKNLTKIPLIYSVSYFNLGGLSPPNPPVATGLDTPVQVISVSVSNGSVNSLSTYKIKSILLLMVDFAADSSRCS